VYLNEIGAAQRDDLHDAVALRERDSGATLARTLQVLPPCLHPGDTYLGPHPTWEEEGIYSF
jgi:hypothetical protein